MDEYRDIQTEDDTRLMINNIVCENFKSYAGVRSLGPFHKNFTAIVGPNGSGKSNVIDAMLFVFGFRASKIRSKKVGVLIHNSDKHKDVRSCTVSVHFQRVVDQPGDGFDVVPGSQFVVGRTAFKDNSSYYTVNGKKMAFREVSVLLKEAGIDLDHNRFLILQGEVEQIALMKPKAQTEHEEGMLEYLEDIIGSSRFKEPIEQLEKKVEELNECRGEKLNRVKAVEKEKDSLEGARNEALNYIRTENAVAVKNHMLLQRYIYDCQQEEARASEVKTQQKEEMDRLTVIVEQCEKKKQDVTKSHEADLT
jgi:structural maintenance of chromosome 4